MTTLFASLRIALRALRVNKMRSALTMLGVIIGVGAVIAMIAVGSGAKAQITAYIASIGSNLLIVRSASSSSGGIRMGSGTVPTLTIEDSEAILNEIPSVRLVAPEVTGVAQVVHGNQNWSTSIVGTVPEMLEVRNWPIAFGRPFTQQDVNGATKVCLLGWTVMESLFEGGNPLGQTVRIKNMPFTVIGVLSYKGQSGPGHVHDDTIVVPLTTAQQRLFGNQFPGMVQGIAIQVRDLNLIKEAEQQINALLRQRHRIPAKEENDFSVRNLTEVMAVAEQSADIMSLLLG